ncbi:tRNA 2-thiouridine(34) synthase MnmA [Fundidesulfovibrio terrae]|uniref:tRNA 2-thiouridine(34) synthase MnmA n=1 Tax=Fundidesulfovibrio terrae TaxID=2922866 RepID=UPI001FAFC828|nr:tRNA 2-thiouridine(34) synthase MnmA [Fundidesulfovibrio terrae]
MTIAVAVSGGMDSLLALALLREAGHAVLALHAHFLAPDGRQRLLAQALDGLCRDIGVPFHAVDLSARFRQQVIAPFVHAYVSGLTPNPCAGCNRDMKFGLLFEEAARLGADRIATGHYARLKEAGELIRGADPAKDQSYFLTLTPPQALARAVFPLGEWRKADVPAALAARGLAPPLPSESQEICFIPGDDYRAFLEAQGVALPGEGPVVLPDGREIGRHQGLWRYTIGQRKGIGIAWSEPLYVLDKRADENALVVGPKSGLDALDCRVRRMNFLVPPGDWPSTVLAQTCYRQRPRPARAQISGAEMTLVFESPVPKPTPGQVAAVFDGDGRALAGGIIT